MIFNCKLGGDTCEMKRNYYGLDSMEYHSKFLLCVDLFQYTTDYMVLMK